MKGVDEYYDKTADWNGIERWQCRLCGFDCLKDVNLMIDHMESAHFPANNPYIVEGVVVADKRGREIQGYEITATETVLDTEEELLADGIDVSALKADDVLKLVEDGELTAEAVIEAEQDGKQRVTILRALGAVNGD